MRLYSPVPNMCVMILVIPQYVKCSPYHLSEEVLNLSNLSHYFVFLCKNTLRNLVVSYLFVKM